MRGALINPYMPSDPFSQHPTPPLIVAHLQLLWLNMFPESVCHWFIQVTCYYKVYRGVIRPWKIVYFYFHFFTFFFLIWKVLCKKLKRFERWICKKAWFFKTPVICGCCPERKFGRSISRLESPTSVAQI